MILLVSVLLTIALTVYFFMTFNYEVSLGIAWGAVSWSAVSFYHSKRL